MLPQTWRWSQSNAFYSIGWHKLALTKHDLHADEDGSASSKRVACHNKPIVGILVEQVGQNWLWHPQDLFSSLKDARMGKSIKELLIMANLGKENN